MIVDANAMGGFLVINPRSGQGPNAGELRREAERLDIDARILGPGDDPGEVAREAPEGPLGAAGGDGTLAAVADVAVERGWPFVVVPFGTRNHLARDLGLDREDPLAALRAFGGRQARIDVARVNGRLFLNNVSLGLYARMVHEQDGGNTLAQLKALGLLLRHPSGLGVTVDGRNVHARVVVVSNNRYSLESSPSESGSGSTRARSTSTSRTAGCPEPGRSAQARRSRSTPERDRCARRSTASRNSSRRRCGSRSSRPRYECFCPSTASTSRVCGNARSSSEISEGANQRNSATSSCGSGTPSTMRAVQ